MRQAPTRLAAPFTRIDRLFRLRERVSRLLAGRDHKPDRRSRLDIIPLEDRSLPNGTLPVLSGLHLQTDTGASATDGLTWDPTVLGTVTNDDGLAGVVVEVDRNGDGTPDDRGFPALDGSFSYSESFLDPGPVSYRFRTGEWDSVTNKTVYGPWSNPAFQFAYEYPPNAAPQIASVGLYRDTGTAGDKVTFDPTVTGQVTDDGDTAGVRVEFDDNGDGVADGLTYIGSDGTFLYGPDTAVAAGSRSVRVRARQWDADRGLFLDSPWSAPYTFTLTAPPAAQVQTLALARDTGTVGDKVTFDPTLVGTVGPTGGGLSVSFDTNGDGKAEDRVTADATGAFRFRPTVSGGVTVNARYEEWDATTGTTKYGNWVSLSYTVITIPPPVISEFKLKTDTGASNTDLVTSDSALTGLVTFEDGAANRDVQFDFDGDGTSDATALTDGQGRFDFTPFDLPFGQVTVKARASAWDGIGQKEITGSWKTLTFTLTEPTVTPPTVAEFKLVNDTGSSNTDGKTTDPSVSGKLTDTDSSVEAVTVEFDHDGDGVVDGTTRSEADGTFTYRPVGLPTGSVTVRVRGTEWDPYRNAVSNGAWKSLTLTLESASNTPAQVSQLKIKTDTGPSNADGKTTDPTLVGAVTNADGDSAYLAVEFDEDGDGKVSGTAYADAQGKFEYRPRTLKPGAVTVKARAVEFDPISGGYVRGDWQSASFTLELDTSGGSGVPTADGAYAGVVGEATAAFNTAIGGATGGGAIDLGIGKYEGAQGYGVQNAPANSAPLTVYATTTAPAPRSQSGTITISRGGSNALSLSGTYSNVVTANGNQFVIDTKISYTYTTDLTTVNGGRTTTLHQTGSYSFVYHASGTLGVDGNGGVVITGGAYNLTESTSMAATYTDTNNYTQAFGGVTVTGTSTLSATGNSLATRTENGTFSSTPAGATSTGHYTLTGGGSSSGSGTDSATYVGVDPFSSGGGTINSGMTFGNNYTSTETMDVTRDNTETKLSGTVVFDASDNSTQSLDAGGTYTRDFGGTWVSGAYTLKSNSDAATTLFHYSATATADNTGLTMSGDFQVSGNANFSGSYTDAGNYKITQANYSNKGTYSTAITAGSAGTSTLGMHFDMAPAGTVVSGTFGVNSTASMTVTNGYTSDYSGTVGAETYSGQSANTTKSTDTVVSSSNSGNYWSNGAAFKVDGTFAETTNGTGSVVYSNAGTRSRPNHSVTFSGDGTRDTTEFRQQSGQYHIDNVGNVSVGTFSYVSTEKTAANSAYGTDDTDVILGSTAHATSKSKGHADGFRSETDVGTFAGDLSNTTWAGSYTNTSKVDWTGTYDTTNDYSGNGRTGSTVTTWSGTNGYDNTESGTYKRDNTTRTVDGTYTNKDYDTGVGHSDSKGTYQVTSPTGWTKGGFTSVEDSTSTFSNTDSGTLTVRNASTTRTGTFLQKQTTKRDTDDTDNWTYSNTVAGRTDAGSTDTTSKTHYDAWLNDGGSYTDADGKLTSKGTTTDNQITDSKNTRSNTNNYTITSPGMSGSGTSTGYSMTDAHGKNSSTIDYTRDLVGISLSGNTTDWSDLTISRKDGDAGSTTRTGKARSVTLTYNNNSTYDSHETTSGTTKFTQGGTYPSGSTAPRSPGAGRYTGGVREVSGHADTDQTTDTTGYDYSYQNSPSWEDDGDSGDATGYVTSTTKSTGHATFTEAADFTSGAAGKWRGGTFNRTTDGSTRTDSGSSRTVTNNSRTKRGTSTTTVTGWVTKDTHTAETNGKFEDSTPAVGPAFFSRSAHTDFSSTMKSSTTDTASANFVTVEDGGQYGATVTWGESGSRSTTRNATEAVTDKSDYSYATTGSSRSGSITRNKTGDAKTTGTWTSYARSTGTGGMSGAAFSGYGMTFGLFDEYGYGTGGGGAMWYSGHVPTGTTTQSASRTETWNNRGASTYTEQGTYSGKFGGSSGSGGGYGGPPGSGSGGGGGSGSGGGSGGGGYVADGYARNGTFTSTDSSNELWTAVDQDGYTFSGKNGSANRNYNGSGKLKSSSSSTDNGSYTADGTVQTTTGTKSTTSTFEDTQKGASTYSSNYDDTVGTDHWYGSASGGGSGNSRVTKSVTDSGAGYTRVEGGPSPGTTRNGGTTNVVEDETKKGKYNYTNSHHYTGQQQTYQSSSGSGSGGPPQQVWVNVYQHGDGTGSGNSSYTYHNNQDTTYAGANATSKYSYNESSTSDSKSDGSSSSYFPSSGKHSGTYHSVSNYYHYVVDSGTQAPDGTVSHDKNSDGYNGALHRERGWGSSWGETDGVSFSSSWGDTSERKWTEGVPGSGGWIDWLQNKWKEYGETILDWTQTALDVASMFAPPGVGAALALANAGISLARGKEVDWVDVALSAVPGVGAAAKAFKLGSKALKVIGAAERTIGALGDAYNVASGLYHGGGDLYEGAKKIAQGDVLAGLGQMGSGAMSVAGAAASVKGAAALGGRYAPCQQKRIYPWSTNQKTCFVAGTPLKQPDGLSKRIEQFQPGDLILTKNEFRPESECTVGVVAHTFTRVAPTWYVRVNGVTIETTAEHPFWVRGFGWKPAAELADGDELLTSDGRYVTCGGLERTGRVETVYNLEVHGDHTYFVGDGIWGFDVWVHNATHSVYVLEKNGQVVYVGITEQKPRARKTQHKNDGKDFDQMRVIATGLPDRRAARNIEGSALYHIHAGSVPGVSSANMLNDVRKDGSGFKHAYRNNNDPERPLMSASDVSSYIGGTHGPTPPQVIPR